MLLTAAPLYDMEKHCNVEIAAQISRASSTQNGNLVFFSRASDFFSFIVFFLPFRLNLRYGDKVN